MKLSMFNVDKNKEDAVFSVIKRISINQILNPQDEKIIDKILSPTAETVHSQTQSNFLNAIIQTRQEMPLTRTMTNDTNENGIGFINHKSFI